MNESVEQLVLAWTMAPASISDARKSEANAMNKTMDKKRGEFRDSLEILLSMRKEAIENNNNCRPDGVSTISEGSKRFCAFANLSHAGTRCYHGRCCRHCSDFWSVQLNLIIIARVRGDECGALLTYAETVQHDLHVRPIVPRMFTAHFRGNYVSDGSVCAMCVPSIQKEMCVRARESNDKLIYLYSIQSHVDSTRWRKCFLFLDAHRRASVTQFNVRLYSV